MKNLIGNRYTKLTVASFSRKDSRYRAFWNCICDCGCKTEVRGDSLARGNTRSCGCLVNEWAKGRDISGGKARNTFHVTHGHTKNSKNNGVTSEYVSWRNMKQRCFNSNSKYFYNYGGRGITVCDRWLNSFENFLADMGKKPDPKLTIDRINNDGNYEPSNCRWATRAEQNRNQRK